MVPRIAAPALGALLLRVLAAGPRPAAGKDAAPTLDWRRTYGDALMEARIRNLPVFVTRHKDE